MSDKQQESAFEVGKEYRTRGGWKARVIWAPTGIVIGRVNVYAIHKPGDVQESCPVLHDGDGRAEATLAVYNPPTYGGHPADLMEPWEPSA